MYIQSYLIVFTSAVLRSQHTYILSTSIIKIEIKTYSLLNYFNSYV